MRWGFLLALSIGLGCGGDDGAADPADAAAVDAPMSAVDAAVDAAAGAFLGLSCDMANPCPGTADCLSLMAGQPGYCTVFCGESNVIGNPPTEGDAICVAIYDEAVGTPVCGIPIDLGPPVVWDCAINCEADGLCPASLTCQDFNFSRYCLP